MTETSNGAVIAGAVIGSFVGIVLIIIIIYFVAFRKKNTGETCMYKYIVTAVQWAQLAQTFILLMMSGMETSAYTLLLFCS